MLVKETEHFYIFSCPHCNQTIEVKKTELNCKIFRCGILKSNFKQIGPHTSKIECDRLKQSELIFGCGKPFKFVTIDDKNDVVVCDYI